MAQVKKVELGSCGPHGDNVPGCPVTNLFQWDVGIQAPTVLQWPCCNHTMALGPPWTPSPSSTTQNLLKETPKRQLESK